MSTINPAPLSPYHCVEEVPLHWVRANQTGILLSIIASFLMQQLWILLIPFIVQLISRTFGIRYNVFVRLFAFIMPRSTKTESRELLRFNNLLAIIFLVGALVSNAFELTIVSYVFTGMLTVAVVLALSGFCLGCFMYFQWKKFLHSRRISS